MCDAPTATLAADATRIEASMLSERRIVPALTAKNGRRAGIATDAVLKNNHSPSTNTFWIMRKTWTSVFALKIAFATTNGVNVVRR